MDNINSPNVTRKEHKTSCCEWILARHVFAVFGFLSLMLTYARRIALSVAIVAMVNHPGILFVLGQLDESTCKEVHPNNVINLTVLATNKSDVEKFYEWDIRTQSTILSSFFYGYIFSQIAAGVVAQRIGGKLASGITLVVSSILTLITPVVASWGAVPLIVLRASQGILEGTTLPALNIIIAKWIPFEERTTILAIIYSGMLVGCFVGLMIGGVLASTEFLGGWPSIFYVLGAASFILSVLWFFFVFETPSGHPRISDAELEILKKLEDISVSKTSNVPWLYLLRSIPAWALNFAAFGYGWMFYFLMMELPTYLYNILLIDIKQSGYLSSMMYLVQAVSSILAGYVSEKIIQKKLFSVTTVRKLMNSTAAFGSAVCIVLVMVVGCRSTIIVALVYLAMALSGFSAPGYEVVPIDMSPTYTGVLTGIMNTFTNVAGCFAPYVTGELTHSAQTSKNWSMVFVVAAAISLFCGLVFHIFGSSKVQSWDPTSEPSSNSKPESSEK